MIDPISTGRPPSTGPLRPGGAPSATPAPDDAFATQLRTQLERVSQMQAEADEGVQNLLTGKTDSLTDVFTAARKAEVAFSLLMEIRNKLADAYSEIRQLRV